MVVNMVTVVFLVEVVMLLLLVKHKRLQPDLMEAAEVQVQIRLQLMVQLILGVEQVIM